MPCELAPANIRVNAIAPGPVETKVMHDHTIHAGLGPRGAAAALRAARRIVGIAVVLDDNKRVLSPRISSMSMAVLRSRISA
jgi:NAD(P)-dependent dehydrogenase (short-subunit alcohol dehydrogenase family)